MKSVNELLIDIICVKKKTLKVHIDELGKNLYAAGAKTGMAFALSLSDTTNK